MLEVTKQEQGVRQDITCLGKKINKPHELEKRVSTRKLEMVNSQRYLEYNMTE